MKVKIYVGLFLACLMGVSPVALAAKPACYATHGGYCQYDGKVKSIYVNSGNIILLYFDTAIPTGDVSVAGFSITNGGAAAYRMTDNPAFANLFYSTALAAQASGRAVTIQMRGTESGYLQFDRIWLAE